ncbi:hypothetical protein [Fibrella aquatilis]|uniref:Uncharacterized protein n=1 Tax=Fibrella aquatilis TaxID=2817059 RepID=A0A939G9P9_9BACT|nr:hypothetical protein [Fibrella aquatilis]MBO0933239.1 hypothetical protein [Fibrella aquatilis]
MRVNRHSNRTFGTIPHTFAISGNQATGFDLRMSNFVEYDTYPFRLAN